MQVYSIVVTTETSLKEQLWESHFKQPMVKQAPVILTFCADFNRFNRWCEQRDAKPGYNNFLSFITAAIDALLAAQNVAIAAETQGLGICYLGTTTYMAQRIIDILKLPKGVVPVTTIVLGHPDETPELTDRLPLEAIVHYETYQDYTPETIDQLYSEKETSEFYKKIIADSGTQNLAEVFTQKRYTQADNEHFSRTLLQVLAAQGFMQQ
jgi:hypothetical protein